MSSITKRFVFGALALVFIVLTLFLVRAGLRITFDEMDYWIGYLGLCLLLESFYLALHFSLKTALFTRPEVVTGTTRVIAAIVALAVSLIFVLLIFIIATAMIATGTETLAYFVDLAFILLLVGVPAFFLWRHVLRAIKRAEQIVGRDPRERVSHEA